MMCVRDVTLGNMTMGCESCWELWGPLHTRLKAHDHCILRSLIDWEGRDRPSSLRTRRWRPKVLKKLSWMKSLHVFLHGILWLMLHGLLEFALGPPWRSRIDANSNKPRSFVWSFDEIQGPSKLTWSWPLACVWSGLEYESPYTGFRIPWLYSPDPQNEHTTLNNVMHL